MKIHLHHIGLAALVGGVLLSGVVNNPISGICVLMAAICWLSLRPLKGNAIWLGLLSLLAWVLVAAICSLAF